MSDQPARPGTIGRIAGEPIRLASHRLDPATGSLFLRTVVRGSAALERLHRVMAMDRVEIVLPDDDHILVTTPVDLEITTTGTGQTAFHRADLQLRLPAGSAEDRAATPPSTAGGIDSKTITAEDPGTTDLLARLDRIEAKLERLIALLERQTL